MSVNGANRAATCAKHFPSSALTGNWLPCHCHFTKVSALEPINGTYVLLLRHTCESDSSRSHPSLVFHLGGQTYHVLSSILLFMVADYLSLIPWCHKSCLSHFPKGSSLGGQTTMSLTFCKGDSSGGQTTMSLAFAKGNTSEGLTTIPGRSHPLSVFTQRLLP